MAVEKEKRGGQSNGMMREERIIIARQNVKVNTRATKESEMSEILFWEIPKIAWPGGERQLTKPSFE